jgi:hypothetical protein
MLEKLEKLNVINLVEMEMVTSPRYEDLKIDVEDMLLMVYIFYQKVQ